MPGSGDTIPLTQEVIHRRLKNALEFMDSKFADHTKGIRKMWFNLIPKGAYPLGEGLTRKRNRFFGPIGDQGGQTDWRQVAVGRDASESQEAYDACRYDAKLVDWGVQTIDFTIYETARRTKDFCINDLKWNWQFRQQLGLIYNSLNNVTVSVWEHWGREQYLRMCASAGRLVVLAGGAGDSTPFSVTYDPFSTTEITIPHGDVSMLSWDFMDWWHQALSMDVGMKGSVGSDGDMPTYGLCVHPKDFKDMIMKDSELREDFRFSKGEVLIEHYGKVKTYQGYSLMNDMMAPRFKIKDDDGTSFVLERVLPWTEVATTIGVKPELNPDYLNAEFAIGTIYLRDVFSSKIPPAGPATPAKGFQFGAVPGLNGEWMWLNYKTDNNPLGEKGRFFGRFQSAADPGENDLYPVSFLYRRCVTNTVKVCSTCGDAAAAVGSWVSITAATAVPRTAENETDELYTQVQITLASCLGCEIPTQINVDYDGDGTGDVTAYLTESDAAPTYMITFEDPGKYVDTGKIVANTSKVQCVS